MTALRQERGRRGEVAAAAALRERGFAVVAHNYRIMSGEVDLVARRDALLLFVEVKTRGNPRFGGGLASVTWRKQRRIAQAARHYLACHGSGNDAVRFDVIEVDAHTFTVRAWVEGAFVVDA